MSFSFPAVSKVCGIAVMHINHTTHIHMQTKTTDITRLDIRQTRSLTWGNVTSWNVLADGTVTGQRGTFIETSATHGFLTILKMLSIKLGSSTHYFKNLFLNYNKIIYLSYNQSFWRMRTRCLGIKESKCTQSGFRVRLQKKNRSIWDKSLNRTQSRSLRGKVKFLKLKPDTLLSEN